MLLTKSQLQSEGGQRLTSPGHNEMINQLSSEELETRAGCHIEISSCQAGIDKDAPSQEQEQRDADS